MRVWSPLLNWRWDKPLTVQFLTVKEAHTAYPSCLAIILTPLAPQFTLQGSTMHILSLKDKVSADEWQLRCDLAVCCCLVSSMAPGCPT